MSQSSRAEESRVWKGISLIILVTSAATLIVGIILHANNRKNETFRGFYDKTIYKSCHEAKGGNGLYYVQLKQEILSNMVFCDENVDGGGWILVASISHQSACSNANKWLQTPQGNLITNWENRKLFGNIESATIEDYKAPAYFNYKAENIMIWLVERGTKLSDVSSKAKLKYYTRSNLLREHGGNLWKFYSKTYGLKKLMHSVAGGDFTNISGDNSSLVDARASGLEIEEDEISIQFNNETATKLNYGGHQIDQTKRIEIVTSSIYPFTMMTWVGNADTSPSFAQVKIVHSSGGISPLQHHSSHLKWNEITGIFTSFQVEDSVEPLTYIFYVIANPKWSSHANLPLVTLHHHNGTETAVSFSGTLRNVLLGYTTLLRSEDGSLMDNEDVEKFVREVMQLSENYNYNFPVVMSKVHYVKGSNGNKVVKFRSYEQEGFPFGEVCSNTTGWKHDEHSVLIFTR